MNTAGGRGTWLSFLSFQALSCTSSLASLRPTPTRMLLHILLAVSAYCGPPPENPGPSQIVVGEPIFEHDRVRIPFTVTDPSCCEDEFFVVPGFDPSWGNYIATQVGLDWAVRWSLGVEYIDCPFPIEGRMACGWYPPAHGYFWPTRDDLGEPSDNWWKGTIYIQDNEGEHLMAGAAGYGHVAYAFNDEGVHPYCPTDGVLDYGGTSGGTDLDVNPREPLVYGQPNAINALSPTLRVRLDAEAQMAWTMRVIWTTWAHAYSWPTLHGEVVYLIE